MTHTPAILRSPVPVSLDDDGRIARFGLIALATDLTSERDLAVLLPPDRAALHVSRIAYENPTTPENLRQMGPRLSEAAALILPGIRLAAICYSCTSASVEIGDREVASAIAVARPGVAVVTPSDAAVSAFAALGIGRIALVTPYLPETTAPMAEYFTRRGLGIVSAQWLGMADDREMARVSAATIIAAAEAADRPDAEGIFLSCTALPALGVIAELETRLGKPVVTSNQASAWRMLAHAGLPAAPHAPGKLFQLSPNEVAA